MIVGKSSPPYERGGFTLVELLIVTLIIAILATITITAYTGALQLGKSARTRAQIAKINDLIAPRWESYQTRRVRLSPLTDTEVQTYRSAAVGEHRAQAARRLDTLRLLMRLELPERITDLQVPDGVSDSQLPLQTRLYRSMAARLAPGWLEGNRMVNGENKALTYQNAECLFLILANVQEGDTNGLEFFRPTEIGDADGDGMREIHDAWGEPIRFLRWAPGFVSDKQQAYLSIDDYVDNNAGGALANYMPDDSYLRPVWIQENPDPFDPLGIDFDQRLMALPEGDESRRWSTRTFYLYPLVISAGPDRVFDVLFNYPPPMLNYGGGTLVHPPNNPFFFTANSSSSTPLGSYEDQGPDGNANGKRNDLDNVHNHLVRTSIQ